MPAFDGVIQFPNARPALFVGRSCEMRERRDFSLLPLDPRLREDDEFICPQDFLTASYAGMTKKARHRPL